MFYLCCVSSVTPKAKIRKRSSIIVLPTPKSKFPSARRVHPENPGPPCSRDFIARVARGLPEHREIVRVYVSPEDRLSGQCKHTIKQDRIGYWKPNQQASREPVSNLLKV